MKFKWDDGEVYCRCLVRPRVSITTVQAGQDTPLEVDSVGFVKMLDNGCEGHIYGTVSPARPKFFAHLEQAKAYVEEQSLIGLTVNKLTR